MSGKYNRWIFPIFIIIIAAAWVVWPNNPGIHIGSFQRDIKIVRGLDLQGGLRVLLEADLPPDTEISSEQMETARGIIENRVNGLGVTEPLTQVAGGRRILVELPGIGDPQKAVATIKETGLLEFVELGNITSQQAVAFQGRTIQTDFQTSGETSPTSNPESSPETVPEATPIENPPMVFKTVMTGAVLEDVWVSRSQTGQYRVAFSLTDEGSKVFSDYTSAHVGDILAIVLDKEVISAPSISTAITTGQGTITGNFTQEGANNLAVQLRYGALPIPLTIVENKLIGPTLGRDSLEKSTRAGAIGLIIVVLFMVLYYRLPGFVADIALLVYAMVTFSLFKLIPVTLTLPGIAGFVLSLGVAVDANILIFERLKEELRSGRSLSQAIDLGFSRAWPSIRDSNLSTLITCAILYWFGNTFGASIVKGFSLTLALGVLVSLFTAITVTRTLLHIALDKIKLPEHPRWFGVYRQPTLDIVGKRYWFFGLSLLIIIPGMIALLVWGLPLAIDFTGGSLLEIHFEGTSAPNPSQVVELYKDLDIQDSQVQNVGENGISIRSKTIDEAMKGRIVGEMEKRFGGTVIVDRFDSVGPAVGLEVAQRAAGAVGLATLGIFAYITYAFRGIPKAFRYGAAAIIAMLHDVAVVVGVEAILGHFLGWEVDALFLTALLTVIGFSVHDSIVVFDRIRENQRLHRRLDFETLVNNSIDQTLVRSINTQLTVMLTLLCLLLFGGVTTRHFVTVLLVGVLSGTYSSIFNASPILVVWENQEWRRWFRRKRPQSVKR